MDIWIYNNYMCVYIIYILCIEEAQGDSSTRGTRGNTKSCIWGEVTSATSTGCVSNNWKASQQGRTWGTWARSWPWVSNAPSQQKRSTASWAALRRPLLADQGKWSFPCTQHLSGHIWDAVFSSGLPGARKMCSYWTEFNTWTQRWLRDCSNFHIRRDWESWHCLTWKKEGSGDLIHE